MIYSVLVVTVIWNVEVEECKNEENTVNCETREVSASLRVTLHESCGVLDGSR